MSYREIWCMLLLIYSPFNFHVLPVPNSDNKHCGGKGSRNGTPVFGLGLEVQVCVNTLQTFTINGSSTGEPPETVAVVTPDGENVTVRMYYVVFHVILNRIWLIISLCRKNQAIKCKRQWRWNVLGVVLLFCWRISHNYGQIYQWWFL